MVVNYLAGSLINHFTHLLITPLIWPSRNVPRGVIGLVAPFF
jgi:hypothetical protein